MTIKTSYNDIEAYMTKDGSLIRELMHPGLHGNQKQSLAEAIVPTGITTLLHKHIYTEEIYHITQGVGMMTMEGKHFNVTAGDTICIPPGSSHQIENTGNIDLKLLCCCSPAYSHEDTTILSK